MPTPLQRKSIRTIGVKGLIRQNAVDDYLIPEEAVTESLNFEFDRIGAATTRPGLTFIHGTLASSNSLVAGLHSPHASGLLIAMNYSNGTVGIWVSPAGGNGTFQFSTSGWGITNASNGWKNSAKVRFVDFLNWTIPLLGGAVNGQTSIDASSWPYAVTSGGEPLNMAQFTKTASVGEVYKSRMYLAGDPDYTNGSRLFFSSVVSSNRGITWTPAVDYVDINPGDGEAITALKRYSLELLVFKPNYTYRFRTSGLDPDPLIRIGTRSQESVVEGKKGVYFHHDTGFYRYSGGYPIEISRPIIDVIEAIPPSQYDDIAGWKDNDHIYWSIGNITLAEPRGSQTWKNVVVRYTESSDIWTIYTYPLEITRGSPFNFQLQPSINSL